MVSLPPTTVPNTVRANIQTPDGLGRAVDGHVHDYDTMHNVDWVDLFELEPRRGKANMVTALTDEPEGDPPACSTDEDEKGILVGEACLEAIEGELNRAYDTLHTDKDGKPDLVEDPGYISEVNSLSANTTFIITLANADLSKGGHIQIGCKVWPVVEYQNMITGKLLGRTSTTGLLDDQNDSLIFTLESIQNDPSVTCPYGSNFEISEEFAFSKGLSSTPTLRIGFGQRSILDEGVHATRSQCVLGLHDYRDAICYTDELVLTAAKLALPAVRNSQDPPLDYSSCTDFSSFSTPPDDYIRDPDRNLHITEAAKSEGKGYRWRNGALTVQLIDASINPSTDLQSAHMVSGAGTHARAYTVADDEVVPDVDPDGSSPSDTGLLYEVAMYWHYSDLVDKIRNSDPTGNTTPKDAPCYGGASYGGKTTIDAGGLTFGEYAKLIDPLVDECKTFDPTSDINISLNKSVCDLERFAQLLDAIDNPDSDTALNQALLELAELLALNPDLANYASMRDYVGDKIPEQKKLGIDQQQNDEDNTDTLGGDGTPADIETYEDTTPELAGPNSVFGRRNWIDLRQ